MLVFFFHQDLVIALQRFRYDLITQESVKLNDRVRFKSKLNMWPYMSTGVTTDDKVVMADYQYELRGVIVHSGIQARGHYISLLKNAEGNWHEFDDEVVTPFNPNHNSTGFAARGFGGTNSEGAEIDENAYTLHFRQCPNTAKASDLGTGGQLQIPETDCLQDKIGTINKQSIFSNPAHITPLSDILFAMINNNPLDSMKYWEATQVAILYFIHVVSRYGNETQIHKWALVIENVDFNNETFRPDLLDMLRECALPDAVRDSLGYRLMVEYATEGCSESSRDPTQYSGMVNEDDNASPGARQSALASRETVSHYATPQRDNWVQCEDCSKWRTLPPSSRRQRIHGRWDCSTNNWNKSLATCDAPEESYDEGDTEESYDEGDRRPNETEVHDGQPKETNEKKKPNEQDTPSPSSENSASEALSAYELVRVNNMAKNDAKLQELGISTGAITKTKIKRTSTRKPKQRHDVVDASKLRRSVRKRTRNHDLFGDNDDGTETKKPSTLPRSVSSTGTLETSESEPMILRKSKLYGESPHKKHKNRRIYRPINSGKTPRPKTPRSANLSDDFMTTPEGAKTHKNGSL